MYENKPPIMHINSPRNENWPASPTIVYELCFCNLVNVSKYIFYIIYWSLQNRKSPSALYSTQNVHSNKLEHNV